MHYLKLILFAGAVLSGQYALAQSRLGIMAGMSYNSLSTNLSAQSASVRSKNGYTIGLVCQFKLNNLFYVQASPNITTKNYTIRRTDSLTGVYESSVNTYTQMPVCIHLVFGNSWRFFLNAGTYIGYWVKGKINGKIPDIYSVRDTVNAAGQPVETFQLKTYDQKYSFNARRDQRLELGWVFGGGMEYKIEKYIAIFWDCSFYQSLTDQQKKYMTNQIPRYNTTVNLTLGLMHNFK